MINNTGIRPSYKKFKAGLNLRVLVYIPLGHMGVKFYLSDYPNIVEYFSYPLVFCSFCDGSIVFLFNVY